MAGVAKNAGLATGKADVLMRAGIRRLVVGGPAWSVVILIIVGLGAFAGVGGSPAAGSAMLVVGSLAALMSPLGAATFALAMTPFAYELHSMPGGDFSLLELGILWTVIGTGLRHLAQPHKLVRRLGHCLLRYEWLIVAAVVLCLATAVSFVSMPPHAMRTEALREIRLVIAEPILFTAALVLTLRTMTDRYWIVAGLVTGGLLASLGAGLELLGFGSGVIADGVTRLTGPYSHPNNLALYLERIALLVLPAAVLLGGKAGRLALAANGVMSVVLILTFSRGGWLGYGAGVVLVLVIVQRAKWLLYLAIVMALTTVPALFLIRDRLLDMGGVGEEPTRFAIWRSSLIMIADRPWTGVGPDQFLYQYGRRYVEPAGWLERYTSHPHNALLDFWVRLGVGGVVTLGALIGSVVSAVARNRRSIAGDWIRLGSLASLAGALVHGMIDNFYFLPDLALLTWVMLVLLWFVPELEKE